MTQRKVGTTFRKGKSRLLRRASGASPSACGQHLGPARSAASSLPFRQRREPVQATPVTYSYPGGDSPGGEDALHLFSIDDAPPKRHEWYVSLTPLQRRGQVPWPGAELQGAPLTFVLVLRVKGIMRQGRTLWFCLGNMATCGAAGCGDFDKYVSLPQHWRGWRLRDSHHAAQ